MATESNDVIKLLYFGKCSVHINDDRVDQMDKILNTIATSFSLEISAHICNMFFIWQMCQIDFKYSRALSQHWTDMCSESNNGQIKRGPNIP